MDRILALLIFCFSLCSGTDAFAATEGWFTFGDETVKGCENGGSSAEAFDVVALPNGDWLVGGWFDHCGGVEVNGIARWDHNDEKWYPLGSGLAGGGFLTGAFTIAVAGDDVYVGGDFSQAGGVPAANIARWNWNTGQWSALGAGLDDEVNAILVHDGAVYAGGYFDQSGNDDEDLSGIARWDGSTWNPLGDGLSIVTSLAIFNDELYAGGFFSNAGGNPNADNIARWNGVGWTSGHL